MCDDMKTQTDTDMTTAVQNIVEKDRNGRTEFVVLQDTIVAPMDKDEAQILIRANIHHNTASYKLKALHELITQKHFFLGKGWHIGFRWARIKDDYFFDLVIGPVDSAGRFRRRVYKVGYLPLAQAEGVARVIRRWLSRSQPVAR